MNDLLGQIRQDFRPYFKEKTLDNFLDFVSGYEGCFLCQQQIMDSTFDFGYFGRYIEYLYDLEVVSYRNWKHILNFFAPNKEMAVDLFFKHYDNYLALKDKSFYWREWVKKVSGGQEMKDVTICQKKNKLQSQKLFTKKDVHKDIHNLIELYRKRPGMYFGGKSLDRLVNSFDGYLYCVCEYFGENFDMLPGFQDFVENYYKTKENMRFNHHWSKLIAFFSPNLGKNDEYAFDEFYKLYDVFLKTQS
jgi:hypothetical protein